MNFRPPPFFGGGGEYIPILSEFDEFSTPPPFLGVGANISQFYQNLMNFRPPPFFGGGGEYTQRLIKGGGCQNKKLSWGGGRIYIKGWLKGGGTKIKPIYIKDLAPRTCQGETFFRTPFLPLFLFNFFIWGGLNFLKINMFHKIFKRRFWKLVECGGSQFYQNLMNFRPPPFFGGGGEYTSKAD